MLNILKKIFKVIIKLIPLLEKVNFTRKIWYNQKSKEFNYQLNQGHKNHSEIQCRTSVSKAKLY